MDEITITLILWKSKNSLKMYLFIYYLGISYACSKHFDYTTPNSLSFSSHPQIPQSTSCPRELADISKAAMVELGN